MASNITSAGSASGMDFESIISALVTAKKQSIGKNLTIKKESANIEVSGVGKLKSAVESFQKAIQALTEDNGFNTRKITTDLPKENPYFSITTNEDSANGSYDIAVEQLAKSDKLTTVLDSKKTFTEGKIKVTLPPIKNDDGTTKERTFEIEVSDDDTVASLRKKINNNDFGVTASTITTSDGKTKLVIDSGITGKDSEIKMEFTAKPGAATGGTDKINSADIFNFDTKGQNSGSIGGTTKWDFQNGQDAIISVDGEKLSSNTNEFRNTISGITINALRVSEKDGDKKDAFKTNNVEITADTEAVTTKMQEFVTAYNTLISAMDDLYKHNTYSDGHNNYDGGSLAGDSMVRSLKTQIQSLMTNVQANTSGLDIYSMGIKFDSDGVMSLDTTKFKDNVADNFNALVNLFSGVENKDNKSDEKNGVLVRLDAMLEEYTKSGGILAKRQDDINAQIKQYTAEEAQNAEYLEAYEASLRKRYSKLDTTISNYNTSLNYLAAALG